MFTFEKKREVNIFKIQEFYLFDNHKDFVLAQEWDVSASSRHQFHNLTKEETFRSILLNFHYNLSSHRFLQTKN